MRRKRSVCTQRRTVAFAGRWRTPHRKAGHWMATSGSNGGKILSAGQNHGALGNPGLHDAGRDALYRTVQPQHIAALCGHRFQQMGHEFIYAGGWDPGGSDPGTGKSLCGTVLSFPEHDAQAASYERSGCRSQSAPSVCTQMSASGLCPPLEPGGAFLGLPLSWFPV